MGGNSLHLTTFLNLQKTFSCSTSSPYFPQSNSEAENGVAIAKRILLKNKYPNLGLMAYSSTKLETGLCLAELYREVYG